MSIFKYAQEFLFLVIFEVQGMGGGELDMEMFLFKKKIKNQICLVRLQSIHSGVLGGADFMCGRACVHTLWWSRCLCGWARECYCDAGGCRSASGLGGWCRWAGRRAARVPPPTDTRDTSEGRERKVFQIIGNASRTEENGSILSV